MEVVRLRLRKGAEQSGEFLDTVVSVYHGCAVSALPSIMEVGLLPTTGAGSDQLLTHFGVPVPGVYVAPTWLTASSYPMKETTLPIPGISKNGVSGGTLIAMDGTPPLRAVLRCVTDSKREVVAPTQGAKSLSPEGLV